MSVDKKVEDRKRAPSDKDAFIAESVRRNKEKEALKRKYRFLSMLLIGIIVVCMFALFYTQIHTWANATCNAPKTCTICGKTEGDALGHSYVAGMCSRCKERNPIYEMLSGFTRIYGNSRFETAFHIADQLKRNLGKEKFDSIVVACGTDFAEALPGSYLANQKLAPILLIQNKDQEIEQAKTYIQENLVDGGTIYLLGGTELIPQSMESGLEDYHIKRLAGSSRYDTNLRILEEAGTSDGAVLVCTGEGFADVLSAAAVNLPILLVNKSLSENQKTWLKGLRSSRFYIIGGINAVNAQIEKELKAYGETVRIEGENRYATSVKIARTFSKMPRQWCWLVGRTSRMASAAVAWPTVWGAL